MLNFYATLGVGAEADPDELRHAYRERARLTHPDRGGSAEGFQRLRQAFDVLRDPAKRQAYDQLLFAHLKRNRAVLCDECGEANRVPSGRSVHCVQCGAELPIRARSAEDVVDHASERLRTAGRALSDKAAVQLVDVGDRLVGETSSLLLDGVDRAFGALRHRLGLGKRR